MNTSNNHPAQDLQALARVKPFVPPKIPVNGHNGAYGGHFDTVESINESMERTGVRQMIAETVKLVGNEP